MGSRPAGGPSDDQLKRLANTLNEIGRQTITMGIRLAPHPHIWGPIEREREVRQMMELTDPKYVWMTTDTGHLTLGGMDAVQIMSDYFPRIAEVHLKDTYAKYRGNTSTPTQEQHKVASVYHNMGGGGVDFPAVFKLLRDRRYKGWAIFDMDGPRKGDDGFDAIGGNLELAVDDYLSHNINYLRVILGVKLPPLLRLEGRTDRNRELVPVCAALSPCSTSVPPSRLHRYPQNLPGLDPVRIAQLIAICLEDPHVVVGIPGQRLGNLAQRIARLNRVRLGCGRRRLLPAQQEPARPARAQSL
jgi:hypothetical protein